ncbi:hypothetical protein CHS0354_019554 [Potamilus streckersoni]|uniref:C2H2-type domain-containing protein n=1 Tax=Potamilus streckersoni TaxID=2493646 RepID=A0AAE0TGH7_9BIVA|nr:hypothetical protein CHS0354_019554 [Potamilus streckersoni]
MSPTKKAAAPSKVAVKKARPSRFKVQDAAKRPIKKAPSSTPTANNPQPGTSTEEASMDPHLINVITQEVSDRHNTHITRDSNNRFDHRVEMLRPSTENSPQTGFPYVPAVPKETTPAASMVSRAILENIFSLKGLRSFKYINEQTGVNIEFSLDQLFECEECELTYPTEGVLLEHVKHYHGRFVCASCKQHFESEKALVTHTRIHDGLMAGGIIWGGIAGAKIGAPFGPVGVIVGTAAGVVTGIIYSQLQKKT